MPCGKCIGCRLEYSRQWAIRCVHEASLWEDNCFLTLTYSDENLPENGSLSKGQGSDFQLFMKRLRKKFGEGIRFFQCGEYGEQNFRPHHHACLFNFDFPDKVLWSNRLGNRLYTSEILNSIWGHGYCIIGEVTFESAAYVARYITKKIYGDRATEYYDNRIPEYITMSRRPGIGSGWIEKYGKNTYPNDDIVINGKKLKPPKYYDRVYEAIDEKAVHLAKIDRKIFAEKNPDFHDRRRLEVKEKIQKLKAERLKRGYENSSVCNP